MSKFLLIVDDEAEIRNIISQTMEESKVNCLMAENGQKALDVLAKHSGQIAAVVSDISMPGMTGLEFIEKTRIQGFDFPVIFITGFGDKKTVAEALRLGAFDFIDKPFDLDKLEKSILSALKAGEELHKIFSELETQMKDGDGEKLKLLKDYRKNLLMMKLDKKVS